MGQLLQFPPQRHCDPRVSLCQPVALVHENATVVTGTLTDISACGVRVVCDRRAADALCNERRRYGVALGPRIDLHFKLPLCDGLAKLNAVSRLTFVSDIARRRVLLGLEFVTFDHDTARVVDTFLREAQRFE